MVMKVILEPAYVLHAKPYRETSLLLELLTLNHGKISVVARSARGPRSRFKGCLQPFMPLLVTCQGKTELLQLTAVELHGPCHFLQGNMLFNGLYLNELLMRLLHRFDSYPVLFSTYQATLENLSGTPKYSAVILRRFEMKLLSELGYGLQLSKEPGGSPIQAQHHYYFQVEHGFSPSKQTNTHPHVFQGAHLLAMDENNFENTDVLKASRRLMRIALGALLGNYEIKTRELFNRK